MDVLQLDNTLRQMQVQVGRLVGTQVHTAVMSIISFNVEAPVWIQVRALLAWQVVLADHLADRVRSQTRAQVHSQAVDPFVNDVPELVGQTTWDLLQDQP
jgi:hypothetical protein